MAIPWMAPHFITGDGPSHLYGATILRELLFHRRHSVYSSIYTIQRKVLPNWTATIALAATGAVAGTDHAEALFASLMFLTGFLGLGYLIRALAPEETPWTPFINFVLQTWFLWVGFYNFYLGMILAPFAIGYYLRNTGRLTWRQTAVLAAGFTLLFFTHLIAVAVALMAVGAIAVWMSIRNRAVLTDIWRLLIAAAPVVILSAIFVHGARSTTKGTAGDPVGLLFRRFPQHIFLTGPGKWGEQAWLWPLALGYIVAGIVLMKKKEWASARGGLAISAVLAFAAYLFVPDEGFGGSTVTIRFAWAVFILGVPLAASVYRLRIAREILALAVSILLAGNLVATANAGRLLSHSVDSYLATANRIPEGATIVRLLYPAPHAPALYGYQGTARAPFFHLDALAAARRHDLDLTDYEPLTRLFPVAHKRGFTGQEFELWSFEGPTPDAVNLLTWIRQVFPRPVDYVLLFGEEGTAEAAKAKMPEMAAYLAANFRLAATSSDGLLRIYARNGLTLP